MVNMPGDVSKRIQYGTLERACPYCKQYVAHIINGPIISKKDVRINSNLEKYLGFWTVTCKCKNTYSINEKEIPEEIRKLGD